MWVKEKLIEAALGGVAFCDAYKQVREQVLIDNLTGVGEAGLSQAASPLRAFTGIYNEATRAAAAF